MQRWLFEGKPRTPSHLIFLKYRFVFICRWRNEIFHSFLLHDSHWYHRKIGGELHVHEFGCQDRIIPKTFCSIWEKIINSTTSKIITEMRRLWTVNKSKFSALHLASPGRHVALTLISGGSWWQKDRKTLGMNFQAMLLRMSTRQKIQDGAHVLQFAWSLFTTRKCCSCASRGAFSGER